MSIKFKKLSGDLRTLLDVTKSTNSMFRSVSSPNHTSFDGLLKYDDTINVKNAQYMFYEARRLIKAPLFNTKNIIHAESMFTNCENLESIPTYDMSNLLYAQGMFSGCKKLKSAKMNNINKLSNTESMYAICESLQSVQECDMSGVTAANRMFYGCIELTELPPLNTSNATNLKDICWGCKKLVTVPLIDMNSVTSSMFAENMFTGCEQLTNLTLKNIKQGVEISDGTTFGNLLTVESLINTCKECIRRSGTSIYKVKIGSVNLEKIANVYVKFTDESTIEIPVGEKGDVVVCDSTDVGAMTIQEYMALKNWTIL